VKFIPKAISTVVARGFLHSQKHSPQMLLAAGVIGMGATVYLSCRATLQVDEVLLEHETKINSRKNVESTPRDKIDLAVQLGKLYAPAVVTGAFSVSCFIGGQTILNRRNAALAAAYGTLEKAFNGYRDRVAAEYGREREEEIYRDVRVVEEENPETGRNRKVKRANGGSPYSFHFGPDNRNWDPAMPTYGYDFLRMHEGYATQRLNARGHLFLNEVLEAIGMEHTSAGAVVGWLKNEGDAFVDFGITNDSQDVIDFMAGRSGIWLDFNCVGTIYDKI
jgi:hypothetical protein